MGEPILGWLVLGIVVVLRAAEATWARVNARRLLASGAIRARHDWTAELVAFHAAWISGMAIERAFSGARVPPASMALPLLAAMACVEGLRAWVFATLGRRWTIVVVVVPGEKPVEGGPYRLVRHPNYTVVLLEILLVPALLGAWVTLAAAPIPGLVLLAARVRREETAWRETGGSALASLPRFVPVGAGARGGAPRE